MGEPPRVRTLQFDETADGRMLKLLNVVDEHTREALAMVPARRINADATVATLDQIAAARGTAPAYIRCDNGPELTANALRDELLAVEQFDTLLEAQVLIEDWRIEYKHQTPAQQPRLAGSGYLRRALQGGSTRRTLIRGGLANGVRSVRTRRG